MISEEKTFSHFWSQVSLQPSNPPSKRRPEPLLPAGSGPAITGEFQKEVKIFPWFCKNIWIKKYFHSLEVRCPSLPTPLPAETSPACLLQLLERSKISWKLSQLLLKIFHQMWILSNILQQQDFKSLELYARKLANCDIFGKALRMEDAFHCTIG